MLVNVSDGFCPLITYEVIANYPTMAPLGPPNGTKYEIDTKPGFLRGHLSWKGLRTVPF